MFGDITAAFGFTVVLCLAPSLLVALAFPPVLMFLTRPKTQPTDPKQKAEPKKRNFITASIAFAQFYFVSLIVLVMASIVFWWAFIAFSGGGAAAEFAVETFPDQEAQIEEVIETTLTETPSP
jgi:multidrug efflux pump subunit AcrB